MALHVTQCPGCDSTFNTSAAMLESAEGKVRCGSCLTIFQAVDNFVLTQPREEPHEEDSVFVGNNPEDYFDPTRFLTRSALQQADEPEEASMEAELEEDEALTPYQDEPIREESIELSEEYSKEFFDAIERTMEASLKEAESENESLLQELHGRASSFYQDFQEPPISEAEKFDPELIPDKTAELNDPGGENTESHQLENTESDNASHLPIDSGENEELIEEEGFVAQSTTEIATPDTSSNASAAELDLAANDQPNGLEENPTEALPATSAEGDNGNNINQERESTPESLELAASFTFQLRTVPPTKDEQSMEENGAEDLSDEREDIEFGQDEEINLKITPAVKDDTYNQEIVEETSYEPDGEETELNQEIVEHDFKESIAAGFDTSESEFESAIFENTEKEFAISEIAEIEDEIERGETIASELDTHAETVNDEGDDDDTDVIRSRALKSELEGDSELESISDENIAAMDVSSTPVQLLTGSQSRWGRSIALGFVIIIFSGGLGAQYLWLNMPAYSQDERIRPFYELACIYAACELPEYSNIAAIRSNALEVRSHPELENGLVVNVEFRNTAPFPQAFPVMILSFNSASNEIVALRELSPEDYLDPALREIAMMPVMSPVQVNLEIIDPGPGAVNYTLAFRLP
ncbi:MAG: zinc-ribbon and DUF3426 domain-containing protein [Gammaproteobacteria bacterium]|nr:zinc-ribbon and DUF3426 domain-containing protein [Gammaproteobacteria bacterium]